ncbi:MauE/DoxX family redox-associated membrane protein [Streptomyces yatensis]|uniref:Methylamine utilisation protein MauE domain-containing protein n=1 Tax=Streptomyces yatensis TaxID=155177 RepID=A0ABN2ICW3_9ACTN|nr:MauE/DoxX family redox-associated membrane protein [Streptomyces yatensis]
MSALVCALAPLVLAGVLGPAGAGKLFGRGTARQAPRTALARLLRDGGRAALVLRALGAVELLLAAALLAPPATPLPGAGAALLGAGFLGYLGYARAAAPGSSCGCTARQDAPLTWRAFARAAAVLAGGVAAAPAQQSWWTAAARRPAAALCLVLAAAAVLTALSADPDRRWRMPLRRLRLRITGHPLAATGAPAVVPLGAPGAPAVVPLGAPGAPAVVPLGAPGAPAVVPLGAPGTPAAVPVAATVELLERSRAWQSASRVVRSALLDHWDDGGWRILQFAGVHGGGTAARPVLVLFAVDAAASLDTVREPAVRVSVIDADSGAPVTATA